MKTGVLVGAAGLALAGVAFAEEGPANLRTTTDAPAANQTSAKRLADFNAFTAQRDARLGAAGSAKRGVVEDEMRALIGAGVIDPKQSLLVLDEDRGIGFRSALFAPRSGLRVSATGNAGGSPGFFSFGKAPDVADDFESYKNRDLSLGLPTSHDPPGVSFAASNGSIVSQVAPWGPVWDSDGFAPDATDPEFLVVVNASDPSLPPDAPATDGSGSATGQMLGAMRTLSPTISFNNNDIDITDDDLWIPTALQALVIGFDYYQASRVETFLWVDLASLQEGFVSVRYFSGGYPNQIGLQGTGLRPRSGDPNAIGFHPIVLGTLAGNFTIGEFYDTGLKINPDEWVTVAQRMSVGGQAMFHRTPETSGDGVTGVLIKDRTSDPALCGGVGQVACDTPFPGFETGWAETYPGKPGVCLAGACLGPDGLPGTGDDVTYPQDGTAPVIGTYLGTGEGLQQANFTAPSDAGAGQAPLLAAVSQDFFQYHRFNDPDITITPAFTRNDQYIDNFFVTGTRFIPPLPGPDQVLPFVDDLERWVAGPIRLQGGSSYFDALSSRAEVITTDNFTAAPGSALPPKPNAGAPTQSLFLTNNGFSAQNTFRVEDQAFYPVAQASPGVDGIFGTPDDVPSVSSVQIKLNNTTNVRALQTSGQTTLVLLGTVSPTTGATDNRVYVREPNFNIAGTRFDYQDPANVFDPNVPETLSQNHERSTARKALQPSFNDNFWNHEAKTSGGGAGSFTIPTAAFFEVRVEIPGDNPQNLLDGNGNQLFPFNLFVNGVQLCPSTPAGLGDCVGNTWVAQGASTSSLDMFSGSSTLGLGQTMTVDDIRASGLVRNRGVGPAFVLPYLEDFEGYTPDPDSLSNQGPIPFLRTASVQPVQQGSIPFYDSVTGIPLPSPKAIPDPAPTANFCWYDLIEYTSAATIPGVAVGDVVGVNDNLHPVLNPVDNVCPGSTALSGSAFTFLAGATPDFNVGGTQLATGRMRLQSLTSSSTPPTPPVAPGVTVSTFLFDQHTENRWRAGGADTDRLAASVPAGNPDPASAKSLRVVATGGGADETTFTAADRDFTFVPESPNPTRPAWVTDFGRTTVDMFVENELNPDGTPPGTPFGRPLQRYSLQVQGIPANGNREDPKILAEMRFGGPDLNPDQLVPSDHLALFTKNPAFPAPPGQPAIPEFLFVDTGVVVPLGQWVRVGFQINRKTGNFKWLIDTSPGEDIFSAGAVGVTDVTAAAGAAVLTNSLTAGVTRIGSLQFRIGNDEGGNGTRVPPKVMIEGARTDLDRAPTDGIVDDLTLLPLPVGQNPWNVARPAGATAGVADWCVYEVDALSTVATGKTAPVVQPVDSVTGALTGAPRKIANQDIIAVYRRNPDRAFSASAVAAASAAGIAPFDLFRTVNRRVLDADIDDTGPTPSANFGGTLLPDCPSKTVNGSTDDGFIFLNDLGDETIRGDWTLEGQPGAAGVNDPFPNGGIKSDSPPYNGGVGDPLPDGSPGTLNEGFRNVVLAQFYMIPGIGAPIEPQRWFLDNLTVTEDCAPVGPGDLLDLLADFPSFGPAGLLDLLSTFGSTHPSCP